MNTKSLFNFPLSLGLIAVIAVLSGCGSSSGSSGATANVPSSSGTASTSLKYTDPVGAGWRLVQDSTSTKTHLVLNLVGPDDGTKVRGVGFNLQKGDCVNFGKFTTGSYAMDTSVFELKGVPNGPFSEPYAGTAADPVLFGSAPIKSGTQLSTGIFQKDRTVTAKLVNQPLVQVAIDLAAGSGSCNAGTLVALSVVKARVIPADIGASTTYELTQDLIDKGKMADISIAVGSLSTL